MGTYKVWRGDSDIEGGLDLDTIQAASPDEAAREHALRFDEGEDWDLVYVLDGERVLEFRCTFRRITECDVVRRGAHPVRA